MLSIITKKREMENPQVSQIYNFQNIFNDNTVQVVYKKII